MSDYLNHLVARTLSPEAGVRPQLRSAFEPVSLHGGFTLPADFELETRIESNPSASLSPLASTPFERVPSQESPNAAPTSSPTRDGPGCHVLPLPKPASILGSRPPPESDDDKDTVPVQPLLPPLPIDHEPSIKLKVLQPVTMPPPNPMFEDSQGFSTPPSTARPDPLPVARHLRTAPHSDTVRPRAAVVPHQKVESEEPRPAHTSLVAIRSVAPAAAVLLPTPSVAPAAVTPRPAGGAIRSQTVEPEDRHSTRFAVAAIRPVTPAAPVFSPGLPPAAAAAAPTIHVTIGRVEVRATPPPPAGSRAKATLPSVMSLEEYLGRRAAGGRR